MPSPKSKYSCDICGFDFPRSQLVKHKGLLVDRACLDGSDPNSRVNWGFYGKQAHGDKTVNTITIAGITKNNEHMLVVGDGPTTISGSPDITAGVTDKELLTLEGTSDTNYVLLNHGNGVALWNQQPFKLEDGMVLNLIWNASISTWVETSRSWYYNKHVAGRYI